MRHTIERTSDPGGPNIGRCTVCLLEWLNETDQQADDCAGHPVNQAFSAGDPRNRR